MNGVLAATNDSFGGKCILADSAETYKRVVDTALARTGDNKSTAVNAPVGLYGGAAPPVVSR